MAADMLDQLTIAELDACSRKLGTDVVTAIHEGTADRWAALAIVAHAMAARTDPTASLSTYRQMTPAELSSALGLDDTAEDPVTDPAAEVAANPTVPAHGSSLHAHGA